MSDYSDYQIVRSNGEVQVYDTEGDLQFTGPDRWSDDDVDLIVKLVWRFYDRGYRTGRKQQIEDIRKLARSLLFED